MASTEKPQRASTFAVPVVLQNLPPAETLNQVIDNLNYLCHVFDEALGTINNQISFERKKIDAINQRINKASNKTDLIKKYPNKSTTVYSNSVFPKETLINNEPLISSTTNGQFITHKKYRLSVTERLRQPHNCDTLSLFYNISEKTRVLKNDQPIGLGRLPSWINNLSDCLLFSTDDNPYLKYESKDTLLGKDGITKEQEIKKMHAAPVSIAEKQALLDQETYDIAYRPELNDVPIFNVPTTLQGLGNGIALDVRWSGLKHSQQKIAPSGIDFKALPELDTLPDFHDDMFGFGDNDGDNDNVPPPKAPTPPPPKPNQNQSQQTTNTTSAKQPTQTQQQQQNKQSNPSNSAPTKEAPPPPLPKKKGGGGGSGGGRADLLASIRLGKKLNNATQRKVKAAPEPKRQLSLMDHLKSKLQARNNLMRGKTHPLADGMGQQKDKNEMLPPKLDENEVLPSSSNDLLLKKNATKLNKPKPKSSDDLSHQKDNTGLGLSNVPISMRTSMLLVDDNELSDGSAQSWNDDE